MKIGLLESLIHRLTDVSKQMGTAKMIVTYRDLLVERDIYGTNHDPSKTWIMVRTGQTATG